MADPKPIALTVVDSGDYVGPDPQPLVHVGALPFVADFVAIDETPADAAAVATDLKAVVDALIAAGLMAAS